jgi:hypothetical protein
MNRPRLVRGIKITWTALCGLAVILLLLFWVRSYFYSDSIAIAWISPYQSLDLNSVRGRVAVHLLPSREWWNSVKAQAIFVPEGGYMIPGLSHHFDSNGRPMELSLPEVGEKFVNVTSRQISYSDQHLIAAEKLENRWGFGRGMYSYLFPHWFLALVVAIVGAAPWLPWRFSLRTLLVATTVIAFTCGFIVWRSR